MTGGKITFIAILPLLFAQTVFCSIGEGILKERIVGILVAHDDGLQLADGSCRQIAIVRIRNRAKLKRLNRYVLLRYKYSCATSLPDAMLQGDHSWRFRVVRDSNCDQKLEDLMYIRGLSPGGTAYQIPLLKRVSGAEAEKIPTEVKLPCYVLRPDDFKSLKPE